MPLLSAYAADAPPAIDTPPPPVNNVPEPGSAALVGLALGTSLLVAQRHRHAARRQR